MESHGASYRSVGTDLVNAHDPHVVSYDRSVRGSSNLCTLTRSMLPSLFHKQNISTQPTIFQKNTGNRPTILQTEYWYSAYNITNRIPILDLLFCIQNIGTRSTISVTEY